VAKKVNKHDLECREGSIVGAGLGTKASWLPQPDQQNPPWFTV